MGRTKVVVRVSPRVKVKVWKVDGTRLVANQKTIHKAFDWDDTGFMVGLWLGFRI